MDFKKFPKKIFWRAFLCAGYFFIFASQATAEMTDLGVLDGSTASSATAVSQDVSVIAGFADNSKKNFSNKLQLKPFLDSEKPKCSALATAKTTTFLFQFFTNIIYSSQTLNSANVAMIYAGYALGF